MDTIHRTPHTPSWKEKTAFWLLCTALLGGFVLSIVSSLGLCDADCNETKYYRFFGIPFAFFGLAFFGTALFFTWMGLLWGRFFDLTGWMLGAALGAEFWFLAVQKYMIGQWCPLCVSIAAMVAIAVGAYLGHEIFHWKRKKNNNREGSMNIFSKSGIFLAAVAGGFFLAFTGISKPNFALRSIDTMEEKIVFGSRKSPIAVYFFSDWFCSACRQIEPEIEKISPLIMGKAKIYFIDYAIHPTSENFSAFNLAFMVHDKSQYMKARHLLNELTAKTKEPTETQVRQSAKRENIPYQELSFSEVRAGMRFFEMVAKEFDVKGTPTMVIVNTKSGQKVELQGASEIVQERIIDAINSLMK